MKLFRKIIQSTIKFIFLSIIYLIAMILTSCASAIVTTLLIIIKHIQL